MKKVLFVFLVLCLLLSVASCKKEEESAGGDSMVEHVDIETLEKDSLNVTLTCPEDWEVSSSSYLGTEIRHYSSRLTSNSDTFAESISVTSEKFDSETTLEEYVSGSVEAFEKTFSNFNIISDATSVAVGQGDGINLVFSYSTGALKIVIDQTFTLVDGNLYMIMCNATLDSYEEYQEIFKKAVESFKIN